MIECNGEKCNAINGVGHSDECLAQLDRAYNVPICFDRAEYNGRVFDNCRFINCCKNVTSICANNPVNKN